MTSASPAPSPARLTLYVSALGDNTDGIGMVRDMVANLGWQIHSRQVAVLGAGGAGGGVSASIAVG